MNKNPYSPSIVDECDSVEAKRARGSVARKLIEYGTAYLIGIAACILLTPVSLELAGVILWPFYPVFAPLGFGLFYLYLNAGYSPYGGSGFSYWLCFSLGFAPAVFELAAFVFPRHNLQRFRPIWVGFPIGFVGTLGVYYTAAASI